MENEEPQKAEEPIVEYGQLDTRRLYTYWDYLKWRFKERVELIKGYVFKMSPAPNVNHQRVSGNISAELFPLFHKKACEVFSAPFDVRLSIPGAPKDSTVVQPDLCIVCDRNKLVDNRACNGAPDLVMEILSPGNGKHEMQTKFELYEAAGVKEYWIVQPNEKSVWVYVLENGKYTGLKPFVEGMHVQSIQFPGFGMEVSDIFYRVENTPE